MTWRMSKPQHRTPEYRAERRRIDKAQAAGQWLTCVQPVCKHNTRDIAPNQEAHVAHDDAGVEILGPAHARCNTSNGATRGNLQRAGVTRWLI